MINIALITDYMQQNKLTQTDFAARLNVSRVTLSNLINNKSCSLETLIALADYIKVSTDTLLERGVKESLHNKSKENNLYLKKESTIDEINDATDNYGEKYEVEKADVRSLIETVSSQQRTIEFLVKK